MKKMISIDSIFINGEFNNLYIGCLVDKKKYNSMVTQEWQSEYGIIEDLDGLNVEVRLNDNFEIIGYTINLLHQSNNLVVNHRGKYKKIRDFSLNDLIEYFNKNKIIWKFQNIMTDTIFIVLELKDDVNLLLGYCFEDGFRHELVKISV